MATWMSTLGGGAITLIGCSVFQLWWQRSAGFGGVGGRVGEMEGYRFLKDPQGTAIGLHLCLGRNVIV